MHYTPKCTYTHTHTNTHTDTHTNSHTHTHAYKLQTRDYRKPASQPDRQTHSRECCIKVTHTQPHAHRNIAQQQHKAFKPSVLRFGHTYRVAYRFSIKISVRPLLWSLARLLLVLVLVLRSHAKTGILLARKH